MVAIVGKPRMGKTTLLKWMIFLSPAKQVFILDYHGEFKRVAEMRPNVFLYYDWKNLAEFKDRVLENSDRAKPSLVIFDEIHMYTVTHDENINIITELYRFAGHHDLFLLCATHRIFDMPPKIRSMMTEFISFKLTERNDLKFIKESWGQEKADLIKSLSKYQFAELSFTY